MQAKQLRRHRIHTRIRAKMAGTKECPRLSVFKSGKHMYAQLINDDDAKVLVSVSDMKAKTKKNKVESSLEIGKMIAKKALEQKIEKVVFDRGGFVFHGRIKAVADGAREGGLKF